MTKQYTASAPATIMIAGEHAVLQGEPAISAALDKRLTVHLHPRDDNLITIQSDIIGHYQTTTASLTITKPFQFILGALKQVQSQLQTGCDIRVESEFSDQVGFGSSAAVTVASVQVIFEWLQQDLTKMQILQKSRAIIRDVQGIGSGADAAASVFGGVVFYQPDPLRVDVLSIIPNIQLIYIGYKTPTAKVIQLVADKQALAPELYQSCFAAMGVSTRKIKQAILEQDWVVLGQYFNAHQVQQKALGVSNSDIDEIIQQLAALPGVQGAKISGSGLGDCILSLGLLPPETFPMNDSQEQRGVQQFNVKLSSLGLANANMKKHEVSYE